ncbi:MAG: hypothetical protein LBE08_05430, partial [Bifidobacteriaceae bacterium]|nr:hypothetical protein [Bifidobacteriaceae bacterium]
QLQEHSAVLAAVALSRQSGCDFADALIAELGARAGCAHTVTFDRRAASSIPTMQALARP